MRATSDVQRLLRAGRGEQPPSGNEGRLLGSLGLSAATAMVGVAGAHACVRIGLRWGAVALLVVTPMVVWHLVGQPPAMDDEAVAGPVIERAEPAPPAPVALAARAVPERQAPARRRTLRKTPILVPTARAPQPAAPRTPTATAIDDELALLRDARIGLRRHDAAASIAALDAYDRAFAHGAFAEEASVLRIEALLALGQSERAGRAFEAFRAEYPRSTYTPSLQKGFGDARARQRP